MWRRFDGKVGAIVHDNAKNMDAKNPKILKVFIVKDTVYAATQYNYVSKEH